MNAWIPAFAGMTTLGGNGDHLLAFWALACTGLTAYPKRPAILLAGLLAYGGMIEMLQSFTPERMAEYRRMSGAMCSGTSITASSIASAMRSMDDPGCGCGE
jgi:hypothetical protein